MCLSLGSKPGAAEARNNCFSYSGELGASRKQVKNREFFHIVSDNSFTDATAELLPKKNQWYKKLQARTHFDLHLLVIRSRLQLQLIPIMLGLIPYIINNALNCKS